MAGLLIYKASAGSGKTYRLVAEYLKMLIEKPEAYREILAVTFTNKATAEMKKRIIDNLYSLSKGDDSQMVQTLKEETQRDTDFIRKQAKLALSNILHDYSMFSISTIDSFVQRIIQNLLWELGQHGNNELAIDEKPYIEMATDTLLDELTKQPELLNHLKQVIEDRLNMGKSPDIRSTIVELGGMLFKEDYKLLNSDQRSLIHNKESLDNLKKEIEKIVSEFVSEVNKRASAILNEIYESVFPEINRDNYMEFFKKSGGILKNIKDNLLGLKPYEVIKIDDRFEKAQWDVSVWLTQRQIKMLKDFVETRLMPKYNDLYSYLDAKWRLYNTAVAISENLSILFIINEFYEKLKDILKDEGVMLLANSGALLKEFVMQTDTPFIYEKIGTRYNSYMLDEFQDTSQLQWHNFVPLITDSLGSNGHSMVVGDVKQSIYRWRNSDWRIMAGIESDKRFYPQVKQLTHNYRSAKTIVDFNNQFFQKIVEIEQTESHSSNRTAAISLKDLYCDVAQEVPNPSKSGYVEVAFLPPRTNEPADIFSHHIKELLIDLKNRGYQPGDIAFLVRNHKQGQEMAEILLQLSKIESQLLGFIRIVSQDALMLNSSSAVRFCIAALKIALEPNDTFAQAQFRKEYATIKYPNEQIDWANVFMTEDTESFKWLSSIRFFPLGYMVEAIIQKYLNNPNIDIKDHLPYLTQLHELAIVFSYRGTSSLSLFIEWYEEVAKKEKLTMGESKSAINIITIHKSKGLEFPVVIFPYADLIENNNNNDSGKIIWFKLPENTPNETLKSHPLYPIKLKKDLIQTYFEAQYRNETFYQKVDDINLQYVAFTRAQKELYLLIADKSLAPNNTDKKQAKEKENKNSFEKYLPSSSNLSPKIKNFETRKIYSYGDKETYSATQSNTIRTDIMTVNHYPVNPIKVKIARHLKADIDSINHETDLQHGIAMHAVLSKVITLNDLPDAIDWAISNGYLSENQRQTTNDSLISVLNSEPFKEWFNERWEVKTEASIINTDGNIYRPDRVLIDGNQAIIVDFKFGLPTTHHRKQVEQYKKLLTDMGYSDVKGYLWYFQLNRHEVV